jgi:hypothetical protein
VVVTAVTCWFQLIAVSPLMVGLITRRLPIAAPVSPSSGFVRTHPVIVESEPPICATAIAAPAPRAATVGTNTFDDVLKPRRRRPDARADRLPSSRLIPTSSGYSAPQTGLVRFSQ